MVLWKCVYVISLVPLSLKGYQAIVTPVDSTYDNLNGILYLAYPGKLLLNNLCNL